jgi:hypothetical protein
MKYKSFFDTIVHPEFHPQVAFTILKSCGWPKFVHLAKAIAPELTATAAAWFDTAVMNAFTTIFGPDEGRECFIRHSSGADLPPFTICSRYLYEGVVARLDGQPLDSNLCVAHAVDALLCAPKTPFDAARMLSCSGANANAWMPCYNKPPFMEFTPIEYVYAMRLRCGLKPFEMPHGCPCGKDHPNVTDMLLCGTQDGVTLTTRHNYTVQSIVKACGLFGIPSTVEPRNFDDRLRPDLTVNCALRCPVVDVTIVDPCCATNLGSSDVYARVQGNAAQEAAVRKRAKYDTLVREAGCEFFPVAFEVFGLANAGVCDFIRTVQKCVYPSMRSSFRRVISAAMASAVQIGNARLLLRARDRYHKQPSAWRYPIHQ